MTQELNKTEAEEHILELMRSGNVEDVLLGARLAVQVMGKEWCSRALDSNEFAYTTNAESKYYICKQGEGDNLWGIHCSYYLTFLEARARGIKNSGVSLTIIDITDL